MLTRSAADDGQRRRQPGLRRRRTPAPAPAVECTQGRVLPGAGVPVQGAAGA